jgi:hypothetical protein
MEAASLDAIPDARLAWSRADQSALVIALCGGMAALHSLTARDEAGTTMRPAGGALLATGSSSPVLAIFPPPAGRTLDLLRDGIRIAAIGLPPKSGPGCPRRFSPSEGLAVVSCGALLRLRWETGIRRYAGEVDLVDVTVTDASSGQHAGFFLGGLSDAPSGLVITFSTELGSRTSLRFDVAGVYGRGGTSLAVPSTVAAVEAK